MRREYPRVPGPGRAIAVTLVVLVALAVGADFGVRLYTEARLASSAQASLGLPQRPDLDLRGFPFLLQFARGRFDRIGVQADDVQVEGLVIDRIDLTFEDVVFDRRALIGGGGTITSGEGTGEAELGEDAVSRYLQDHDVPVRVRFIGPGIRVSTKISFDGATTTASSEGPLRLEGGALVFEPDDVSVEGSVGVPAAALSFELPLPEVVAGIAYEAVSVEEGIAVVQASLAGAQIEIID
ncbi:MAG: DUF2993 domain-containing protein [Actinomycetota bacterium]|nr:DUF2993 domain-containing protein [Actinomycetota bacterium]